MVLVSLLRMIQAANEAVTLQYPGAHCVQVASPTQLAPLPDSYLFTFRDAGGSNTLCITGTEDTNSGYVTWSDITPGQPILGVTGNLVECTVDIYPALKAISEAGYGDPVFFCGLFQAVVPGITQPWYSFTPTNCLSSSSSAYIFVNAITSEVRLFPTDQAYRA